MGPVRSQQALGHLRRAANCQRANRRSARKTRRGSGVASSGGARKFSRPAPCFLVEPPVRGSTTFDGRGRVGGEGGPALLLLLCQTHAACPRDLPKPMLAAIAFCCFYSFISFQELVILLHLMRVIPFYVCLTRSVGQPPRAYERKPQLGRCLGLSAQPSGGRAAGRQTHGGSMSSKIRMEEKERTCAVTRVRAQTVQEETDGFSHFACVAWALTP